MLAGKTFGYISKRLVKKEHSVRLGLLFLTIAISIGATTCTPFLFGLIIKMGGEFLGLELSLSEVIKLWVLALALNKILPSARKVIANPVLNATAQEILFDYQTRVLRKPHSYQISVPFGVKQERSVNARTATNDLLQQTVQCMIPATLELGAASTVLIKSYGGWEFAVSIGGVTLFSILCHGATGLKVGELQKKLTSNRMAVGRHMAGLWNNFETVLYCNTLPLEEKTVGRLIDVAQKTELESSQLPEKISFFHSLVVYGVFMGLMALVGGRLSNDEYSLRDFSVIAYFITQIISPLLVLGESSSKIRAAFSDFIPILEVLTDDKLTSQVRLPQLTLDKSQAPAIIFENVTFAYKKEEKLTQQKEKQPPLQKAKPPTIQGVSFTVESGKKLAIVGPSGSGKSTIARLLYRLYELEPNCGRIFLGGRNIAEVDPYSLRQYLSIVSQTISLFNDDLFFNITYGAFSKFRDQKSVPKRLVNAAIKGAGLTEFVESLPKKLETKVGENALMISGGQKLRVGIARALIRRAPVVILDEHTSALDAKTEEEISENLDHLLKGKTVIIIAHKLSTIRNADEIIVFDNGSIKQRGSFNKLMEDKQGDFAKLWEKQDAEEKALPKKIENDDKELFEDLSDEVTEPEEHVGLNVRELSIQRDEKSSPPLAALAGSHSFMNKAHPNTLKKPLLPKSTPVSSGLRCVVL